MTRKEYHVQSTKYQLFKLNPQNLSIEICVQKIFYIYIYVKNALTKKKKKL